MKKNKYIIIFFVLQVLTFLIGSIYSLFIGRILETFLILYELFYVINVYKGKERRKIKLYLFLIIISLLAYSYLYKDASNLIGLLNISITPIFIYTYYSDNKINKSRVLLLLNIFTVIVSLLTILFKDYFLYTFAIMAYPLLFTDRYYNNKSLIMVIISTVVLALIKDPMILYLMLFYSLIIFANTLFNKDYKKLIIPFIPIAVSLFFILYFKIFIPYSFDSDVFGTEVLIAKIIKVLIAIMPLIAFFIPLIKKYIINGIKTNYEMLLIMLTFIGFVVINIFYRLDYSVFLITSIMLLGTSFIKYIDVTDRKINNKNLKIYVNNINDSYIANLVKMIGKYNIEIISTYKNKPVYDYGKIKIKYLLNKESNKEVFSDALSRVNIFKIIKEGIKYIAELVNKRSYIIESMLEEDSKYIITNRNRNTLIAGSYADKDIIKIEIDNRYAYDNKDIYASRKANYLVVAIPELKELYDEKVKKTEVFAIPNAIEINNKKKAKYGTHNIISNTSLDGQIELLDIISLLKKDYDDVHLYLLGEETKEVLDYIDMLKLNDNVSISSYEDIDKLSLKSSIYVDTSYEKGSISTIIEEGKYSLPIVAFDSLDGVKYLLKNESGILIKNRDKKNIVKEITKLFEDKAYYKKYSDASIKNTKQYEINNIKPMWNNLIK